jgi:hypothetical protein
MVCIKIFYILINGVKFCKTKMQKRYYNSIIYMANEIYNSSWFGDTENDDWGNIYTNTLK